MPFIYDNFASSFKMRYPYRGGHGAWFQMEGLDEELAVNAAEQAQDCHRQRR